MKSKISSLGIVFLVFLLFGISFAQDPGIPDTVRLADITGEIGDSTASMPIFLYNDEQLTEVVIPLLLDGYSGWLRFDSVSYAEGRLADPNVLDLRETYVFATDTFTFDSLLLYFSVSSGQNLPAGTGKICDLWFTLLFGGEVLVDSLAESPRGGLSFINSGLNSFTPRFVSGSIDISCNYKVGDITFDNNVSVSDVVSLQKLYRFDGPLGFYPVFYYYGRADLNCDRRLDMRDVSYLVGFLFRGGPYPCTCGTINSSLYDDPGVTDSVWVENKTMIVGIPSPICFGVVNDELLSGVALSFDIEGDATLVWDSESGLMLTERGQSNFSIWDTRLPPDSVNFNFYGYEVGSPLSIGNEAVCCPIFTPQSAGTATFCLSHWLNTSPSMLVTHDGSAAVLPALHGGNITVLPYLAGDANGDGQTTISDIVYLISYLFRGGPAPDPPEAGDANCDSKVTVSDVVYLVNYLFKGGPPPCYPPFGTLLNYSGCKSTQKISTIYSSNQDCIEYEYDGQNVLRFKHINAGFNCCPDELLADITIQGNLITIREKESLESGGCLCLCLFDLDYQITNLPPGEYTIKVMEPYAEPGDEPLEFNVNLVSSPSGSYCVSRTHYPWGL